MIRRFGEGSLPHALSTFSRSITPYNLENAVGDPLYV